MLNYKIKLERRNIIKFFYATAKRFKNHKKKTFFMFLGDNEIRMFHIANLWEKDKISQAFKNANLHICTSHQLDMSFDDYYKDSSFIIFTSFLKSNETMFYYYVLCKLYGINDIYPYAYEWDVDYSVLHVNTVDPQNDQQNKCLAAYNKALNEINLKNNLSNFDFMSLLKDFENRLYFKVLKAAPSMSLDLIDQIQLCYNEGIPFFSNTLAYHEENVNLYYEPNISNDFKWIYYNDEYIYRIPFMSENNCPRVYFLKYASSFFGNFFVNLGIIENFQYNNGKRIITIQPFVISKSCTTNDLLYLFFYLYKDTEYKNYLLSIINSNLNQYIKISSWDELSIDCKNQVINCVNKNKGLCRSIYNAIIIWANMFVWEEFCQDENVNQNIKSFKPNFWGTEFVKNNNDKILEQTLSKISILMKDNYYRQNVNCNYSYISEVEPIEPQYNISFNGQCRSISEISADVLIYDLIGDTGIKSFTAEDLLDYFKVHSDIKEKNTSIFSQWYIRWVQPYFVKIECIPDIEKETVFINYVIN